MLKAGQSRGSIVCVNGVIIKQCGSYTKGSRGQNDTTHIEAAEGRGQGAIVTRPPPLPHGLKV